jgi:hypothetical protein
MSEPNSRECFEAFMGARGLLQVEWLETGWAFWCATRWYRVVFVHDRTGEVTCMSRPYEPMSHHGACVFKSKMMRREHGRHMLSEVSR